MVTCTECGRAMEERILPEHTEDLGGVEAILIDTVRAYRCAECGAEETEIPDLQGLVRTVALSRALYPVQLRGSDLRLMRRALDVNQKEFATAMGVTPEFMNRWEKSNGGAGGHTEKLLRHNVCALLHKYVPSLDYDPAVITYMNIRALGPDERLAPVKVRRVVMKQQDSTRKDVWDMYDQVA